MSQCDSQGKNKEVYEWSFLLCPEEEIMSDWGTTENISVYHRDTIVNNSQIEI